MSPLSKAMYRHVGLRTWRPSRGRVLRRTRGENRKAHRTKISVVRAGPDRRGIPNVKGRLPGRGAPVDATVGEQYDVYVAEPVPLQEGESKHTISVFVGDESGLINRVAGVFGRRGRFLLPDDVRGADVCV